MDSRWQKVVEFFAVVKDDPEIAEIDPEGYMEEFDKVFGLIDEIANDKDIDPEDRTLALEILEQVRMHSRHHVPEVIANLSEMSQDSSLSEEARASARETLQRGIKKLREAGIAVDRLATGTPRTKQ